jgi:hypothetical protein
LHRTAGKVMEVLTREEAENFYAQLFFGLHHLPNEIKEFGYGFAVATNYGMATYDFNQLTRLVVLAHDMCIRCEIIPRGMNRMLIAIWKRKRDGGISKEHPELEAHIQSIRKHSYPYSPC